MEQPATPSGSEQNVLPGSAIRTEETQQQLNLERASGGIRLRASAEAAPLPVPLKPFAAPAPAPERRAA